MNSASYRNAVLDAFFDSNKLAEEQIDSYNSFVEKVQDYVNEVRDVNPKVSDISIELGEIRVG
ncbi:MAG TPA: hypothetical protein VJI67_01935, partial [archaeon]|nr:hypothetical protein [archaeon]